jgi:glutathione S-transferase
MKLVGSKSSPYVRKVRVILAEKSLACDFLEESAWTATTTVPRYNPLNKVPALVMDDGESIYDSAVIAEYLDAISGGTLIPSAPAQRARARRDEALGDGIADAGIAMFLERKREASRQDAAWIMRQAAKIDAATLSLSGLLGPKPYLAGTQPGLGDFACACALLWLEFRLPEIRWRDDHQLLAQWIARLEMRASFRATVPSA